MTPLAKQRAYDLLRFEFHAAAHNDYEIVPIVGSSPNQPFVNHIILLMLIEIGVCTKDIKRFYGIQNKSNKYLVNHLCRENCNIPGIFVENKINLGTYSNDTKFDIISISYRIHPKKLFSIIKKSTETSKKHYES